MLSRRVVILAAVLALLAVVAVQAKQPHHKQPARRPHPEETADAATLANWARIRAELEARNYTRPSSKDVHHITRHRQFAAGEPLSGAYGVDVSSWVGQSTWTCLKNNGYSFAVVREFMETCQVDGNGVHTVANAWAAGLAHVDIYLFPSYGCGTSPAGQVDAAINSMGSIPFGQIWFDIETGGQSSYANNYNWLKAATDQAVAKLGHARVGIYSSRYEWSSVMGSYSGFQDFPLWWATYDGQPGFGGFSGFAGWTSPAIHQFAGSQGVCGANVDLNWY